jgi:drug/metabolite transporter (DMT)-like permease
MTEVDLANPAASNRRRRQAIAMLLVATLLWGMGFTWAKNVGAAINAAAGMPVGSTVGPTTMLAGRCLAGALLWVLVFPSSRRGWSWGTVRRSLVLGGLLGVGLIVQHLGLDRSTEAITAFLTNLTIVIVPILIALFHRRLPVPPLIGACALALAGIWLLTGAKSGGLSTGEVLGVACAFAFSLEILAINHLMGRDSPARITLGMFIVSGVMCAAFALGSPGVLRIDWSTVLFSQVGAQWALLTVLVTCVSFGLMNTYQPRVEATRATLVYLFEPIFAAGFAWLVEGATMSRSAFYGAGLILVSNIVAELKWPGEPKAMYDDPPPAPSAGQGSEV